MKLPKLVCQQTLADLVAALPVPHTALLGRLEVQGPGTAATSGRRREVIEVLLGSFGCHVDRGARWENVFVLIICSTVPAV